MHAKAVVNGKVIAETDNYEEVEGNVYVSSTPKLVQSKSTSCTQANKNFSSHHPLSTSPC